MRLAAPVNRKKKFPGAPLSPSPVQCLANGFLLANSALPFCVSPVISAKKISSCAPCFKDDFKGTKKWLAKVKYEEVFIYYFHLPGWDPSSSSIIIIFPSTSPPPPFLAFSLRLRNAMDLRKVRSANFLLDGGRNLSALRQTHIALENTSPGERTLLQCVKMTTKVYKASVQAFFSPF